MQTAPSLGRIYVRESRALWRNEKQSTRLVSCLVYLDSVSAAIRTVAVLAYTRDLISETFLLYQFLPV
jgi:hypothetical protein